MGQLSNALGKVNYKGTMGSSAGDLSSVIGDFVAQGKKEKEQATKDALDQALLGVKQSELGLQTKTLEHNVANDDRNFGFKQLEHGDTVENQRLTREGLQQNRDSLNADRDASRAETTRWHDLIGSLRGQNQNRMLPIQDEFGHYVGWNPIAQEGEPLVTDPSDGKVKPKSHLGVAAQPHVAANGAPEQPVQPGAKEDPTVAHPTTTQQPEAKPFMGSQAIPKDAERQMNMLVTSIGPSVDRIDAMYNNNTHAPTALQQGLADKAKAGGLLGGLANTVLGGDKHTNLGYLGSAFGIADPNYQSILTDLTKTYRAFVYVTTGKQLNENEAQDAARQYVIMAGEPDALVQKKVTDIRNMTQAVRNGAVRAQEWLKRYNESTGAAAPVGSTSSSNQAPKPEAVAYYKSLIDSGVSPDEAEKQTDAKFGS